MKTERKVEHTPGPWKIWNGQIIAGTYENEVKIAEVNSTCRGNGAGEANARLIAAAPGLLLACKRAFELEKANHGMTAHAYAYENAIQKAEEGKSDRDGSPIVECPECEGKGFIRCTHEGEWKLGVCLDCGGYV